MLKGFAMPNKRYRGTTVYMEDIYILYVYLVFNIYIPRILIYIYISCIPQRDLRRHCLGFRVECLMLRV